MLFYKTQSSVQDPDVRIECAVSLHCDKAIRGGDDIHGAQENKKCNIFFKTDYTVHVVSAF